jgi:predicted dienelactone hydrolase
MRTLEIVLLLVLLAYLLLPTRHRRWAALAAVLVALLHLGLEGERWQMVPAYALTALFAVITLLSLRRPASPAAAPTPAPRPRRAPALFGRAAGVLAVILAALPPVLFPVPRLPAPGGPYAVGTVTFQYTDPARPEIYTPDPDDLRTIVVQIWYPALPAANAEPGPWMDRLDVAGPAIARFLRLPEFFLDHAELVKTHAYPAAPAASGGPFPVVIYSHGWNGFRNINLNQSEALASHGYVAVAVDHTYGAMVTVFADGGVALNNPDALPFGAPDDVYQRATEVLEATYAADLSFALDQLLAARGPLAGLLDPDRIGFYGHSTGGGAVVLACAQDARCTAGLAHDAWLEPVPAAVIAAGLRQPFLFMRSELWATGENNQLLDQLYQGSAHDVYRLTIAGSRHYDFTMLPLLSPLAPALGLKGPIEGRHVMALISDYQIQFFDRYLKGAPAPLLGGPSERYPAVTLERK